MRAIEDQYHYRVIARALALIDAAPAPGPSLETLAGALGMSGAHFQKVFSAWVGVSPKRYQQYLTLDHARALIAQRLPLEAVADKAGLSGAGRLHDLFLRWEAMSPGEHARGGAGLVIRHGQFGSVFGEVVAMGTDRGLCAIAFAAEIGAEAARADLTRRWPAARYEHAPETIRPWVEAALAQSGGTALHLIGAPFQIKVWEALLTIPSGQVTTYGDIAGAIGAPRAVRAVGTAVGRNPLAFVIPCHRALRKSGAMGGYHWGLPVKRAMLAWESARAEAAQG